MLTLSSKEDFINVSTSFARILIERSLTSSLLVILATIGRPNQTLGSHISDHYNDIETMSYLDSLKTCSQTCTAISQPGLHIRLALDHTIYLVDSFQF